MLIRHILCIPKHTTWEFSGHPFLWRCQMSEVQQIRSLAKQAALFRAHGLLPESRGKYEEILSLLGSNHQFQNAEKLAVAVQNRLEDVEYDIRFRDLREKFFDLSERAFLEYSDSLIGCTRNKGCVVDKNAHNQHKIEMRTAGQKADFLLEFIKGQKTIVDAHQGIRPVNTFRPECSHVAFSSWKVSSSLKEKTILELVFFLFPLAR